MNKPDLNDLHSFFESQFHLRPAASAHSHHADETDDRSMPNLDLLTADGSGAFGHAPLGFGVGPSVVLYSSEEGAQAVHGVPHIFSAAGAGTSGGGTSSGGGAAVVTGAASQGLVINVTYEQAVNTLPTGFTSVINAVVNYFEANFSDPVTINIVVGFGTIAGGAIFANALGESETFLQSVSFGSLKNALTADAKTTDDATAVASLPASDPITGSHNYWMATAEAKALGLNTSTSSVDGYVGFGNAANLFDYNNSDGVSAGQYDFYGVVAHEFSEVMGRTLLAGASFNGLPAFDALDLFHYSASGARTFSGTTNGSYFSIDGGKTVLNTFNNGSNGGDAGDWAGPAADSFNAFGAPGTVEPISAADLKALDAIGWDATASSGSGSPPPPPPPTSVDLTVSILSFHDTTLGLQFTNTGTSAAAASTAGLYLSTDGTINTSDTLFATISIPALAAGASVSGNITVPFPSSLAAGTYHLGVIADYNGQIAESNETNNLAAVSIPIILGNSGANVLNGTSGAEEIVALGSNDTLAGNGGVDTLIGGSGSDHFRYNATGDGGTTGDLIVDFTPGSDVLDFAHSAFGFTTTGTLSSANFVANTTGPTNSAQKFWFNTANFTLYYDADGSGAGHAVAIAQLENHAVLSSSNIHLV